MLAFAAFGGPQDRLDAVRVAGRLGRWRCRAWRDAMQRPELRGYARIALALLAANPVGVAAVGPLPAPAPDDMTWLATDFLAVASDPDSLDPDEFAALFARVVPESQQAWVIGLMSRSSNPDVARFLDLLGHYHPDRKMAKDARRAARAAAQKPGRGGEEGTRPGPCRGPIGSLAWPTTTTTSTPATSTTMTSSTRTSTSRRRSGCPTRCRRSACCRCPSSRRRPARPRWPASSPRSPRGWARTAARWIRTVT